MRRSRPPAKFVHDEDGRRGQAVSSLVSGGCIISGAFLRDTLLFTGVHVHSWAKPARLPSCCPRSRSAAMPARAGWSSIAASTSRPGLVIGEDPELDAQRFRRSEHGVCLVTQPMIDQLKA